ncbi:MAG: glycosyltransferase [Flavobacteriaceae bacterium]|nr:glycosyltransferase [Flavobacteriaceae bacterium]
MKILLVGEYSRLHNSLKEGLESLGNKVTIIATGDYFKNYPVDIKLHRKYNQGISKKLKVLFFKLLKVDITSISLKNQFFSHQEKLKNFDVVQLINESPLGILPKYEKEIILFLKNNNKKLFLLSCGTDYISVKHSFDKKPRYSILEPFFNKKASEKSFDAILKYLQPNYRKLHEFVFKNVAGVIASDLDYHIPLIGHPKYLGLIANPINTEKLKFEALSVSDKIIIFHGINRANYYKKGSDYFEEALQLIQKKYPKKIELKIVENLPYAQYIETYNSAHIVLDQVLAYDQGYNALEAMAKGKVVFTGAEQEWLDFYNLEENTVAINALPDANAIAEKLEWLILNPGKITEIGKNARVFIEAEHNYLKIAEKYILAWNK